MQQTNQAASESRQAIAESPVGITDNGFVINLTSSTTPVSLPANTHPELKRFKFFVSRRREDGRERFRLHLGYFSTQEEAEGLLELVREVYPAAWASVAPGQKLRAQQAAAAVSAPMPAPAPAPAVVAVPAAVAVPAPARPVAASVARPAAPATVTPTPAPSPQAAPAAAAPATRPPARDHMAAAQSLSNVRAAIASLDATAERKQVKADPAAPPLSDAQVLQVLEPARPASAAAIRPRSELTMYALQLVWSVQPIAMTDIPQLAIFSAYTLYGAEGNRDGRRWYGLRLGFFTDATSAKQVAHYVRSEFASVSVVPVTLRERERATTAAQAAAATRVPVAIKPDNSGSFKLIEDKAAAPPAATAAGKAQGKTPTGKRVKTRPPAAKKSAGGKSKREISLEETLEILGASELQIDNGRGELLNESGVRHLRLEADKTPRGSKLGRLINRLADRLGD